MLERSCPIVFLSSVGLESPASVQVVKASGETVQSFRRKMEGSRTRFRRFSVQVDDSLVRSEER